MATDTTQPEKDPKSVERPWRRRLIGSALVLAAVTLLLLSLTVLRTQVAQHHLELSNHIATVDRSGANLEQQRQLLEQALRAYSGAELLRFLSALGSSILALAALLWFRFGGRAKPAA